MKKSRYLLLMAIFIATVLINPNPVSAQQNANSTSQKVTPTEVYYFHMNRRCMTCQTVEKVARQAVNEFFAKEVEKGQVTFRAVNIEEKDNQDLVKKLKISGQTLLVVHDKNKIDLTDKGFMYAVNEPDKLKAEIKTQVQKLSK